MFLKTKTKNSLFFSLLLIIFSISVQPALSVESNAEGHRRLGIMYWQKGNLNQAVAEWKKEAAIYHNQKRNKEEIEAVLRISQAYIKLGQFPLAIARLNRAEAIPSSNNHQKALIQMRIGNTENQMGKYSLAVSAYKKSLELKTSVSTLNNLVIALQKLKKSSLLKGREAYQDGQKYHKLAIDCQSQALKYASRALATSQGQTSLSSVRSLIQWHNLTNYQLNHEQLARGRAILAKLPPSRSLGFSILNWSKIDVDQTESWLNSAQYLAQRLGDAPRAGVANRTLESYVFLESAHFYNRTGKLQQALSSAQTAESIADSELPNDSLYRSQWLAGKIAQKMNLDSLAIKNYQNAIASIDIIARNVEPTSRQEITQFNQEIQPVYRDALEFILNKPNIRQTDLQLALVISDKLRLSELRSYFGDPCFKIKSRQTRLKTLRNQNAVSINSIVLKDKVVLILEQSNGKLVKRETKITRNELIKQAKKWYEELNTEYSFEFRTGSRFFYDLIIKPIEAELIQADVDVLVFIHDSILRNLPMAALDDNTGFLIEKVAVISSIGLESTSKPTEKSEPKALVFGLSKPKQQDWSTLEMVVPEVKAVNQSVDGKKFLNIDFTKSNLRKQLQQDNYSVVHLATHGYFGGTAEDSFILAYDQKIDLLELDDILRQASYNPNLLVLSACQTAIDNDLAFLGLAGVAAKSGINSTLGSLWEVNDLSQSKAMKQFYSDIKSDLSNPTSRQSQSYALALQKIQIEQINLLIHPKIWAALILISD
jgi:CHAT domain-containing protein/tetratricopeptide (TPR) repeat protein